MRFEVIFVACGVAICSQVWGQQTSIRVGQETSAAVGEFQLAKQNGATLGALRGLWRCRGHGYLAKISDDEIELFSETKGAVWKHDMEFNPYIRFGAIRTQALFARHPMLSPFFFERVERMPDQYDSGRPWPPLSVYEVFGETLAEHYAFGKERSIDISERLRVGRASLTDTATEIQLFDAMKTTLAGIADPRVSLQATVKGSRHRVLSDDVGTRVAMRGAFEQQDQVNTFQDFLVLQERQLLEAIEAWLVAVVAEFKVANGAEIRLMPCRILSSNCGGWTNFSGSAFHAPAGGGDYL